MASFRRDAGATGWSSSVDWRLVAGLACLLASAAIYCTHTPSVYNKAVSLAASIPHQVAAAGTAAGSSNATAAAAAAAAGNEPKASGGGGGGGGGGATELPAQLTWFHPEGYELPEECIKHEPLYTAIFLHLAPWFDRGITSKDLDACKPAAPAGHNFSEGTPGGPWHRGLLWDNEVWITSGGLSRTWFEGLNYFMISQILDTARRFGLPNMEFMVAFGDLFNLEHPGDDSPLCPLLTYCKRPNTFEILVPHGQLVQHEIDDWVERMVADEGVPWDHKEEKAVGRFTRYCIQAAQTDRFGNVEACLRTAYWNHSAQTQHAQTSIIDGYMSLSEQRKFKYTLNTDGNGCATRFPKILATGQTVLKQHSNLYEFFYYALQPWVHYVPVGWNGVHEVDWAVKFLKKHDALARAIGQNSQQFVRKHLISEGRQCYLKVLFEEMHKLMRYEPKLDDFPSRITYDDDVKLYAKEADGTFPRALIPHPEA